MPLSIGLESLAFNTLSRIQNSDGTAWVNIFNATQGQYKIDYILLANTDAVAHVVNVGFTQGGNHYNVLSISVPAGAGTGGAAPVEMISGQLIAALTSLVVAQLGSLDAMVEVAMTAGTFLEISVIGGSV